MSTYSFHGDLDFLKKLSEGLLREEFYNEYQPIHSGTKPHPIVGVECLSRWRTKEGVLSAAQFIPYLENTHLSRDFFFYTLGRAIIDLEGLLTEDFKLSINLPYSLAIQSGFSDDLNAFLKNEGIAFNSIILELTESVVLPTNHRHHANNLQELSSVTLCIDDFGTGSTSLIYLQDTNLTELKIDRLFLAKGYFRTDRNVALLDSLIALSKRLGMLITLEGIEEQQHLDLAESLGFDKLQGYFFSKPLPIEHLKTYLRGEHPR